MTILVIDDDIAVCTSLKLLLKQAGYEVNTVLNPDEALGWIRKNTPSLILMDMNYSLETDGSEGIELLRKVRIFLPDVPIILITAWASISLAVEGIKAGATDFISKPWDNENLLMSIRNNLQWSEISDGNISHTRKELDNLYDINNVIGEHPAFVDILTTALRIAPSQATVLITGESGTGKEIIAEAIHNNSRRSDKPFVKVNLGGIPESLFESEMFGHKKGSFTDASHDRKGRFALAEKGTIFLDEIGDLSPASQVKLLRVLQENTYEVLGESTPRKADVRVICATNRNLAEMVSRGEFREDLYYRINLINIHLPSLRQRNTDIPLLASYRIRKVCAENKLPEKILKPDARKFLKDQPFPGNIRELNNLIERSVLMSISMEISGDELKKYLERNHDPKKIELQAGISTLDEIEKESIKMAMKMYNGNVSKVAKTLGLSRGALYRRFEKTQYSL